VLPKERITLIENDITNRIRYYMEYNGWSSYRLAKEAKIPYSSLSNLLNLKNCPTIPTLEKICIAFNISLAEFFRFTENSHKA